MLLKICQAGNPVLRITAANVDPDQIHHTRLQQLIELMRATMRDAGGLGLAAPQVGESIRLVVVEDRCDDGLSEARLRELERYPVPFQVLINPRVTGHGAGRVLHIESCLSIRGYGALVARPDFIRVEALNEHGDNVVLDATGHFARVLEHELDHLDGVLYVDKMEVRSFVSSESIDKKWLASPTDEMLMAFGIGDA